MADMIEIMARALLEADLRRTGDYENVNAQRIIGEGWSGWVNAAKAVRDALRNPTDAMTRAGTAVSIPADPTDTAIGKAAKLVYQVNIDAMDERPEDSRVRECPDG